MRCISFLAALAFAAFPRLAVADHTQVDVKATAPNDHEIEKRKDELAKLQKRYRKEIKQCQDGDRRACSTAQNTYAQIQLVLPTIPPE